MNQAQPKFVSPLGTLLRGFVGHDGTALFTRVAITAFLGVAAAVTATARQGRHAGIAVLISVIGALFMAGLFACRSAIAGFGQRLWERSQGVRWL